MPLPGVYSKGQQAGEQEHRFQENALQVPVLHLDQLELAGQAEESSWTLIGLSSRS